MTVLALVPCELGGIVVESAIYGMFVIMFVACLYCLLFRRRPQGGYNTVPVNKAMLAASIFLFISITAVESSPTHHNPLLYNESKSQHWILDIIRLFQAFVPEDAKPLAYYANLSIPVNVAKTGLYIIECIVADLIMCYRLWTVWGHNKSICAFPLCTTLAFLVTGIGITYQFSQLKPDEPVFLSICSRWITSAFASTLVTNIYCTSFISYKIWSVSRAVSGSTRQSNTTMRVIVIVVESAAIYTCFSLATLTAYLVNSNFQFPALDSTSPVVGFVFCLIIVRVSLGFDHDSMRDRTQQTTRGWIQRGLSGSLGLDSRTDGHGVDHIDICISRHVESNGDNNSWGKTSDVAFFHSADAPDRAA